MISFNSFEPRNLFNPSLFFESTNRSNLLKLGVSSVVVAIAIKAIDHFAPTFSANLQLRIISCLPKCDLLDRIQRTVLQRLADQGDAQAQFNYAVMLYHGEGGHKDLAGARDYFQRAADQGHADAQHNYMVMLCNGEGGDSDLAVARDYFQQAADQGHAEAQNNYASMLAKGEGGDRDLAGAREYFKKSEGLVPLQRDGVVQVRDFYLEL